MSPTPLLSLIPPTEDIAQRVHDAYDELERRDLAKTREPQQQQQQQQTRGQLQGLPANAIAAAIHEGLIDAIIPFSAEGRLTYLRRQIDELSAADGEELFNACKRLRGVSGAVHVEDIDALVDRLKDGKRIMKVLKSILLQNIANTGDIIDNLYTLVRTSPAAAINMLSPRRKIGVASACLSLEKIPGMNEGPIMIGLSRSTIVKLYRTGTVLTIESTEWNEFSGDPKAIVKNIDAAELVRDTLIVVGRDIELEHPLGMKEASPISICDWGIEDPRVSRAACGVLIEKSGQVYLLDFHSTNGATLTSTPPL